MRIDFVSDVACPWCAVGLNALERALERIGPDLAVELYMQPFELNPTMPPEGANAAQYLKSKYGISDEQLAANRARIAERGAAEGFTFGVREHVWNTFDAHCVLHWAGVEGEPGMQRSLKHALLRAYHGEGRNPGAHDVLVELATQVGLPSQRAREVLERGEFADEVREAERFWQDAGIHSVPAVVIDRRHLISGGQPSAVFEQALRQIAAEHASA
ncbi:MAG: DsbA family oxidoreductase [Aquincola sp.]|nr:DsbA family oxidoreductase [Aquincola sp.]